MEGSLDNNKENYFIQITLDGMIKVSEDEKDQSIKEISLLLSKILKRNGMISSKSNINVISELEVLSIVSDTESYH